MPVVEIPKAQNVFLSWCLVSLVGGVLGGVASSLGFQTPGEKVFGPQTYLKHLLRRYLEG